MAKGNGTWIDLRASPDDVELREYHQSQTFEGCPFPETQAPQMIMLIGESTKRKSMAALRFGGTARPDGRSGDVRLIIEPCSVQAASPILYSDCELHVTSSIDKQVTERTTGDILRRSLAWGKQMPHCLEPRNLADLVYAKLMSPFATLICFFADDFSCLRSVARILASWLINLSSRPSDLPVATRPQVMIFMSDRSPDFSTERKATQLFHNLLRKEAEQRSGLLVERVQGRLTSAKVDEILSSQFGRMQVVALPPTNSSNRKWRALRDRILKASEEVHVQRIATKIAFSTDHFQALFHLACDHFCTDIASPLNFIQASRISNPVPSRFGQHIAAYMKNLDSAMIFQFAVPVIVSALVLDAFPPDMHYFDPALVFDQLYRPVFQIASVESNRPDEDAFEILQLANAIEAGFCKTVTDIVEGRTSAAASHKEVLFRFRRYWRKHFSDTTCLACLAREPENALQCGHTICNSCTTIHGNSDLKIPLKLKILTCPLCNVDTEDVFRLKPPTAGVRVLSIDGGGVRGLISIIWLKELESVLRLPMPVQNHFDIAVGTSSGGMVVLGLYCNKWTVDKCEGEFQNLAHLAFRSRIPFNLPILSIGLFRRIREIFFSCITDSRYSSTAIDEAVQAAYGQKRHLFGLSPETKIAITATTTDRSSTVLFSNYNNSTQSKGGYRLIRPENQEEKMFVWEIARATSAAPPFFKSYKGYHDGALGGHNNPINLALWEQNSIWDRRSKQPDIVLSLGTGSRIENDVLEDGPMSKLSQLFLPRLLRSFMMLLDGQKTWVDLLNSVSDQDRPRYHRLNISFPGAEPQLDDVKCMKELKKIAKNHALSRTMDLNRCADNILASLFYVELDRLPVFKQCKFFCEGRVLCRLDAGSTALYSLVVRLRERQARFYLQLQNSLLCVNRKLYDAILQGEPFSLPIEFQIFSMSEKVDFKIDGITQRPRSISNFPYAIADMVVDQGLHLVFGRSDHKRRLPYICHTSKRRKYN